MAKKKLLSLRRLPAIGSLLLMLAIPLCSYGVVSDEDFAKGLSNGAINMTWEHLVQAAKESRLIEDLESYMKDSRLLVFVSSSMSLALLKAYVEEASKYKAVLIFKGLPSGSFKELSNIVTEIAGSGKASIQIDEEAFAKYFVTAVPTIVLSREDECIPGQSCKLTFDKIAGNIGIGPALERFSYEGELSELAGEILKYED